MRHPPVLVAGRGGRGVGRWVRVWRCSMLRLPGLPGLVAGRGGRGVGRW